MAYTKTTWVNDQSPDIDADNLNKMEQGIYDAQYPDGGSEGQLLARTATGKAWVDAPNSAVWGLIQGTLSDQTDLATALANTGKVDTVNGIQPDVYKNVQVDIELTKAEYDALPSSKESDDVNYWIKDGTDIPAASVISASGVAYGSGTVADALDNLSTEAHTGADAVNTSHSLLYVKAIRIGKMYVANVTVALTETVSAWTTLFTLKNVSIGASTYFPAYIGGTSFVMLYVSTTGSVSCVSQLSANTEIKVSVSLALN